MLKRLLFSVISISFIVSGKCYAENNVIEISKENNNVEKNLKTTINLMNSFPGMSWSDSAIVIKNKTKSNQVKIRINFDEDKIAKELLQGSVTLLNKTKENISLDDLRAGKVISIKSLQDISILPNFKLSGKLIGNEYQNKSLNLSYTLFVEEQKDDEINQINKNNVSNNWLPKTNEKSKELTGVGFLLLGLCLVCLNKKYKRI